MLPRLSLTTFALAFALTALAPIANAGDIFHSCLPGASVSVYSSPATTVTTYGATSAFVPVPAYLSNTVIQGQQQAAVNTFAVPVAIPTAAYQAYATAAYPPALGVTSLVPQTIYTTVKSQQYGYGSTGNVYLNGIAHTGYGANVFNITAAHGHGYNRNVLQGFNSHHHGFSRSNGNHHGFSQVNNNHGHHNNNGVDVFVNGQRVVRNARNDVNVNVNNNHHGNNDGLARSALARVFGNNNNNNNQNNNRNNNRNNNHGRGVNFSVRTR